MHVVARELLRDDGGLALDNFCNAVRERLHRRSWNFAWLRVCMRRSHEREHGFAKGLRWHRACVKAHAAHHLSSLAHCNAFAEL